MALQDAALRCRAVPLCHAYDSSTMSAPVVL